MQVPYGEGVACRTGPVPCATDREVSGEALVRGVVGWVLSRESGLSSADRAGNREGNTVTGVTASPPTGSAWSETPGTRRRFLHGSGEISSSPMPSSEWAALGRRKPHANDARRGEVGPRCSSREVAEQSRATGRGGKGAKSGGQGECSTAKHGPDTGPGNRAPVAGPHTSSGDAPWPNQRFDVKHPRQEPSALAAHARICAGGAA
jgi:hypothetical protein